MDVTFYISAAVAVLSTILVIASRRPVHALLYFIVSLLAVAVMFYVMGAPFVAMLQVIIYAGAIMVLFMFVIMMINLGSDARGSDRGWLQPSAWLGPSLLAAILVAEVVYILAAAPLPSASTVEVTPAQVGQAMFGPYVLGVEMASLLLLAGLVGAYHLARRRRAVTPAGNDAPDALEEKLP
ncbi:MAG: NADH-quinone oxidoreductase subunit J [Phycisphaerae bacterium]|jgi:NADH-quinone oxidoreductase subunit J